MWIEPEYNHHSGEVVLAFIHGIAKAILASAIADAYEEANRWSPMGVDWYELTPSPDGETEAFAAHLAWDVAIRNGLINPTNMIRETLKASGMSPYDRGRASELGSDMAMQMLGHGVSWLDGPTNEWPTKDFMLPDIEFIVGLEGAKYAIDHAEYSWRGV